MKIYRTETISSVGKSLPRQWQWKWIKFAYLTWFRKKSEIDCNLFNLSWQTSRLKFEYCCSVLLFFAIWILSRKLALELILFSVLVSLDTRAPLAPCFCACSWSLAKTRLKSHISLQLLLLSEQCESDKISCVVQDIPNPCWDLFTHYTDTNLLLKLCDIHRWMNKNRQLVLY